jgi:hypothetical protein
MKASVSPRSRTRPFQQVQHLRLAGHVKARHDLIRQNEIGLQRDGARDADALALAARQFVRDSGGERRRQADMIQRLRHPLSMSSKPCSRSGPAMMVPTRWRGFSDDIGS